ncbi:hypothetical protein E2C01_044224 [Portunus trituberculatus]|uniref:Uncharacterized protein n=1 Tax=Portunus trituberculatus TaxID=210409 RepID=A0A5B7FXU1_PORTR|nr:hypothetical protein [Portunus trituberculatus]
MIRVTQARWRAAWRGEARVDVDVPLSGLSANQRPSGRPGSSRGVAGIYSCTAHQIRRGGAPTVLSMPGHAALHSAALTHTHSPTASFPSSSSLNLKKSSSLLFTGLPLPPPQGILTLLPFLSSFRSFLIPFLMQI